MKTILFVLGTRPEAIKLAPLILHFREHYAQLEIKVCITAQHRQMLDDILDFFSIEADYDLNLMKPNQQLSSLTAAIISGFDQVLKELKPSLVIVQGDTTTAMAGALCAFYERVKVAHVEAGLRSHNLDEPFPEEVNRKIISQIAALHFAPTNDSYNNLLLAHTQGQLFVTGNTVIDALFRARAIIHQKQADYANKFVFAPDKRYILVTIHRRENFGEPLHNILRALNEITLLYEDVELIIPVHPNPNVKMAIEASFQSNRKVRLLNPLSYDDLIWVMSSSYCVITDSGGIQEEAPSLGKPVLVLRNVTERMEGVNAGTALLIGNQYENVSSSVRKILDSRPFYETMSRTENPYGTGKSCELIADIIDKYLHEVK